jgi:hypothetical protein
MSANEVSVAPAGQSSPSSQSLQLYLPCRMAHCPGTCLRR